MKLTAKLKKAITLHASETYPNECCGVIVNDEYMRCNNIADNQNDFEIDPHDLIEVEQIGDIQAYVHSHPDASARASDLDLLQIELHNKTWVICAYPDVEFQVYEPCGYKAPLVGRNYVHGYQDCYTLVRDFYSREMGINIPNFERVDKWWEDENHAPLYLDNFEKAGFYEVEQPQYGDVLICKIQPTFHANHALIWLGDNPNLKSEDTVPCIATSLVLHHPYNRPSVREVFGEKGMRRVVKIVRHKDAKNH